MITKTKTPNFTKEFASIYFSQHNNEPTILLTHKYEPGLEVKLMKNTIKGKKTYQFLLLENWKVIFENSNSSNKWSSFDEVFDVLYKHPIYKENNKKTIDYDTNFDTKEFENLFEEYIDDSVDVQSVFGDKETLTTEELQNILTKALQDSKIQEQLYKYKEIHSFLNDVEDKLLSSTELPERLYELASIKRWQISKLEKILVNRAKSLVIKCTSQNPLLLNNYLKEFDIRFFDYHVYGETSPSKYAITPEQKHVPKDKNLLAYIEVCINNPSIQFSNAWHSWFYDYDESLNLWTYVTRQQWKLEKTLGWDYLELVNFVALEVQRSVYFFRPEKQKEDVKLDTYIYSSIKNALMSLQNYTSKVDQSWVITRWKDSLITKKLKEVIYNLNEKYHQTQDEKYIVNIDNIYREIEEYNSTIKDPWAKISKKEVSEFYSKIGSSNISIDSLLEWDEWESSTNDILLHDIWSSEWESSIYNPVSEFVNSEKQEAITNTFTELFQWSVVEEIVLQCVLRQIWEKSWWIGVWKRALRVDLTTVNETLKILWQELITQTILDQILNNIYVKLLSKRDHLSYVTWIGSSDNKTFDEFDEFEDLTNI